MFFVFFPSYMDAEKEAAARRTRGSQRLEEGRRRKRTEKGREVEEVGERRRGGQRHNQEGEGERGQPRSRPGASRSALAPKAALESRACQASASLSLGVASRSPLALVPLVWRRRGSRDGRLYPGAESAVGTTQRPSESRAALAAVGMSTRHGRGLASITAGLPRPPCWEETTRHAAAERLQKRKRRRRRRCLPRAAETSEAGGGGRRAWRGPSRSATAARRGLAASCVRLQGGVGRGGRPAAPKLARGAAPGGAATEPETVGPASAPAG
ncbi:uncharacterized protein LOC134477894 [Cavia porcellus]|uniref:uncharacterized protein LOC134477894 n=1 Tax=Cavia porcellus TaxID=10141 RepID=UPI002FDFFA7D